MTPPLSAKKITNPKPLLPHIAWDWLSYKPSLTKRLREFTHNQISFHVLSEGWKTIEGTPTWVRKIQWRLHDACWIEADLRIAKSAINAETQCLLDTQERPIGEQLFKEPSLTRSDFEYFLVIDQSDMWIRQSVFHFKQQPLTLKETFFPAFFKAIQS